MYYILYIIYYILNQMSEVLKKVKIKIRMTPNAILIDLYGLNFEFFLVYSSKLSPVDSLI